MNAAEQLSARAWSRSPTVTASISSCDLAMPNYNSMIRFGTEAMPDFPHAPDPA